MEALIIIFYVGALIFYIWMICLFVGIAKNVKTIRQRSDNLEDWTNNTIKQEIKLSILKGTQQVVYNKIIDQLSREIYINSTKTSDLKLRISSGYGLYPDLKKIDAALPIINDLMKLIGRELPSELQSVEAYVKFYNSDLSSVQ